MPSIRRVDWQTWSGNDRCEQGGLIESLRLTRQRLRSPLPIVILNIIRRGDRFVHQLDRPMPRTGLFAVQITFRIDCTYGHYMILFVTPSKAVLFDSGDCVNTQYERTVRLLLDRLDMHQTLDVWRTRGLNKKCVQCSLWTAFGYHLVTTRSLQRLWDILNLPPRPRQQLLDHFHKTVLSSRPLSTDHHIQHSSRST